MPSIKSAITDIEHLSKTRNFYENELSFAGRGLKLNTKEDARQLAKEIEEKENLKVLRLEGNTIAPDAAEELAKALEKQKLERFIGNDIFTGRLKDEIPLALRSMCGALDRSGARLVEINMSDNAFGPIGLNALMDFFQAGCCFSLKEFRLHNNGLGPEGAKKLATSLEKCYHNSGGKFALRVFICGRNRLEYEGAKAVSNSLKLMGSLEEIQMPQNGIRPNGIEFIADACANNPNLRIVNFNDNTFRSSGGELMAKALNGLNNLEYINLGDCLLRSKGSRAIAKSLAHCKNVQEVILSFNEISLDSGIEIAKILANKSTLKLIDLNGNKFGEDGKLDLIKILEPVQTALSTLSEDEGSDDEGEAEESEAGEEEEDEDEEDNSEVVVNEEDYEDYEEYEEGDEEEEEEEEYEEEEDEKKGEEKFGSFNIVQQPSLFKPFGQNNSFQLNQPTLNLNRLSLDNSAPTNGKQTAPQNNLFSNMIAANYLKTNSVPTYDAFITNPTLETFKQIDQEALRKVTQLEKFNGKYLLLAVNQFSKIYNESSSDDHLVLKAANLLFCAHFSNVMNIEQFSDEFLIQFGFLKSEEKNFRPTELTDKFVNLLTQVFNENFFPTLVKQTIRLYLDLRIKNVELKTSQTIKKFTPVLINALAC